MEWLSYLLFLICPLMMIFCMKGHSKMHKHNHTNSSKELESKIVELQEENKKLNKELHSLSSIIRKES